MISVQQLLSGNRAMLSKALTLIESDALKDRKDAIELLDAVAPHTGKSLRVGICGPPGVGKSSLIESFGLHLLSHNLSIAVLAVDPSSPLSGGSILGDKARMQALGAHERAFVRPSPSKGFLGGAAPSTINALLLCEAAQFDVVIVESVGVGQSDVDIAHMSDVCLLLVQPASGDELQGMKRGLIELADILVITKCDGDLEAYAHEAKRFLNHALAGIKTCPKLLTSAHDGYGIKELWSEIQLHKKNSVDSGSLVLKRIKQSEYWLTKLSLYELERNFLETLDAQKVNRLAQKIAVGELSLTRAALNLYQ